MVHIQNTSLTHVLMSRTSPSFRFLKHLWALTLLVWNIFQPPSHLLTRTGDHREMGIWWTNHREYDGYILLYHHYLVNEICIIRWPSSWPAHSISPFPRPFYFSVTLAAPWPVAVAAACAVPFPVPFSVPRGMISWNRPWWWSSLRTIPGSARWVSAGMCPCWFCKRPPSRLDRWDLENGSSERIGEDWRGSGMSGLLKIHGFQ